MRSCQHCFGGLCAGRTGNGLPLHGRRPQAGLALGLAAPYAATDEFHQTFVPSRQGSVWDVLLDTGGACVGLIILWAIGRLRKSGRAECSGP
jgi:VanZ family protein